MHTIIHSLILAYPTVKEAGRSQGERAWQSGPGDDNAGIKARGGGSRGMARERLGNGPSGAGWDWGVRIWNAHADPRGTVISN